MGLNALQQRIASECAPAPAPQVVEDPKADEEAVNAKLHGSNGHHPEPEPTALRSEPPRNISYPPDIHRLLPQAPDVEKGLLEVFAKWPEEVGRLCVQRGMRAEAFHIPAHRIVFEELLYRFNEKLELDFSAVGQSLHNAGKLEAIGGLAALSEIFANDRPTPLVAAEYIETVQGKAALREAIALGTELASRAYNPTEDPGHLVADFIERFGRIARPKIRLPGLRDVSECLGENKPPRPPELVHGILHQGSKIIIGGTSKGRKTFSLLDLAISVASGVAWWGFPCVQGRVCYINFEIQEPFFMSRVEDICRGKNVTLPPGMLMAWTLRGHSEGIEKLMQELLQVLLAGGFTLIIFDPIYKALGDRDENKAGDVASLCNELEKIAVRTGAAIAFGAHYSKGNQAAKESIDRIGGSGVFARDPDSILTMTAHEQEECFTVEATLRNFRPLDPFVVKWDWPLFHRETDADPAALKQPKKAGGQFEPKHSKEDVLEELSVLEGIKPGDLVRKMRDYHNMGRTTVYRFIAQLNMAGKVVEKDRMWFRNVK